MPSANRNTRLMGIQEIKLQGGWSPGQLGREGEFTVVAPDQSIELDGGVSDRICIFLVGLGI